MLDHNVNLLQSQAPPLNEPPRPKKLARVLIIAIAALALLNWGFKRYSLANWPQEPAAYDVITLKPKNVGFFQAVKNWFFHSNNLLEGQIDDRVNILILGIGGAGHDGPYLSDTNILASLKPSTHQVALVSIPRDLGVKIGDHGWRKINSADAYGEVETPGGGGEYARKIFAETFNLNIPYYVRVDFTAFEKIINAVGGVTVEVAKSFTDPQFPGPNNSYQTINFVAGRQTMDGTTALNFVRSRHGSNGEDSDFARSRRQQLVLAALKQELLSANTLLNPIRIKQIYDSLAAHIVTNLDFGQLMYLGSLIKDLNGAPKNLVLDSSPKGYLINTTGDNGAYILSPKTGTWDEIDTAILNVFNATSTLEGAAAYQGPVSPAALPLPLKPGAKIEIQNGTWRAGLASRVKTRLEAAGLNVIGVSNSLKRPNDTTSLIALNQNAETLGAVKILETTFKISASAAVPAWLQENYDDPATLDNEKGMKYNSGADILVILGDDVKE